MALPDSYVLTPNRVQAYFDAILNANPPDRFSYKFLENLEFKSSNDRLLIGVLKELGFIDTDGLLKTRYYEYLDSSKSQVVLSEGIREAYADLFAVYKDANKLSFDEVKNKLRTLYAGTKTDETIARIAKTFEALCGIADFSQRSQSIPPTSQREIPVETNSSTSKPETENPRQELPQKRLEVHSLQYHINIVLPESRDQAVYDAIFKSMKEHLG